MADDELRTGAPVPRNTQAISQSELPPPQFTPNGPAVFVIPPGYTLPAPRRS